MKASNLHFDFDQEIFDVTGSKHISKNFEIVTKSYRGVGKKRLCHNFHYLNFFFFIGLKQSK